MKHLIRPAILLLLLLTVLTGILYPLFITGLAQLLLPPRGQWKPDRQGRPSCGVGSHRAAFRGSPLFLGAAFGDKTLSIQQRRLVGFQSGTVEPGTDESRPIADRRTARRRSGRSPGRSPWIWLRLPAAASIPTSARLPPSTRSGVLRRPGDSRSGSCRVLSWPICGIGISASSGSPSSRLSS